MKYYYLSAMCIALFAMSMLKFVDIYSELQVTKEEAKERMIESIAYGMVIRGNKDQLVANARNMPVEVRVEAIRELMRLAKEYSTTSEFASKYKAWRKEKLNPNQKTKIGLPRLGKIIDNKIDNKLDKEKNEKMWPAEPKDLIRTRLEEYIALVATVDFDAELNGSQFMDPEYQKKSYQWKACFRAGREVNDAALIEAKKWLDELNVK